MRVLWAGYVTQISGVLGAGAGMWVLDVKGAGRNMGEDTEMSENVACEGSGRGRKGGGRGPSLVPPSPRSG